MTASRFNDVHESPDERMQRRRARRWKRRMRMAGPFLGIPLLLGTLALSVDLIEYDPEPAPARLSDRPIPKAVAEKAAARGEAPTSAPSVSGASVVESGATSFAPTRSPSPDLELQLGAEGTTREQIPDFAPPPAPYALRGASY